MSILREKFLRKKKLLKLINRLPGTIFQYRQWKNGHCTFPYSTKAIEEIFFASPLELSKDGQIAWEKICPESVDSVHNAFKNSAEHLTEFELTFNVQSSQNRTRRIRAQAVPERLRDGSTLWHGYMEDITAQHEADEAAKQRASLLNVIFENLPDHIYYKDRLARMLGANPTCCQHHGRPLDEIIGKNDIELYSSDLGKKHYAEERRLMDENKVARQREEHVRNDGSIVYLESVKSPLRSPSGRVIGLAGISRDITQQVENEKALILAKHEAEQSASFIHALFDNLEDTLYYKDRESKVLGGNRAWVISRGAKSIDELIGKTDIDLHPAPLGQQMYDNEQRQMETGEVTRIRERHTRPDGTIKYVESIKCPMRNERDEIIGLAGISRDITLQVENEKILIDAHQEAEDASRAKSAFLAMMSHEIRTPMNGVIGAASLLMKTDLSQLQDELINTIQVSGESLLILINDILDYSKIEAGKIELEQVPFDLRNCIENVFDLFAQTAAKKNVELLYSVHPNVPASLLGDTTRLRQILVNLVGNAIKFTENGEVCLNVHRLNSDDRAQQCQIQFEIQDTGIGIADEHKSNLFQAFTQAESSSTRKYGGTGLGLTISRKLTELMGGKIWFESEAGKGTVFYFTVSLPVDSNAAPEKEPPHVERLHGKCALIVDDNRTSRRLLGDQLAQWGITPEAFDRPEKALKHLEEGHRYDIALIDFQMPGMNGADLAKKIRRLNLSSPLPVILLGDSGENIPEDPAIRAHLSKPVKKGKLCEQILQTLFKVEESAKSGTERTDEPPVQSGEKRSLRILIAEDNALNRRVVQIMLQQLNCEHVAQVTDGEEAVTAVRNVVFDLILMDIQMPHMSGIEATRLIREQTGQPEKPWIIALTAGVMPEEQQAAKEAGMNGFLAKPLDIEQLRKTLDELHLP